MWNVYVLRSSKKRWYYVGSTSRLAIRLKEHGEGKVSSTRSQRPLELVRTEHFNTEAEARSRERLLKDRRLEKEVLIRHIEEVNPWEIV